MKQDLKKYVLREANTAGSYKIGKSNPRNGSCFKLRKTLGRRSKSSSFFFFLFPPSASLNLSIFLTISPFQTSNYSCLFLLVTDIITTKILQVPNSFSRFPVFQTPCLSHFGISPSLFIFLLTYYNFFLPFS